MSRSCTAGGTADRARIQRAARSLRLAAPAAAVDTIEPDAGPRNAWVIEATLVDRDRVPSHVLSTLVDEDLDLLSADPQGPHTVIVATA